MKTLVLIPTYNERENLPLLVARRAHGARDRDPGHRRSVARRHRPACRRARRRSTRGGCASCTGAADAAWGCRTSTASSMRWRRTPISSCQMDADRSHDPQYLPAMIAATAERGPRGRLALHARHQRRQLAAAPHHPVVLRQRLHPVGDRPRRQRLHQRLSLLAARGAGEAAARSHRLGWLCLRRRGDVPGRGDTGCASPSRRSSSSSGARGRRRSSSGIMFESLITPWRLVFRHGRVAPGAGASAAGYSSPGVPRDPAGRPRSQHLLPGLQRQRHHREHGGAPCWRPRRSRPTTR